MLVARLVTRGQCLLQRPLVARGQCLLQRPLPAVAVPCISITQRRRYCSRPHATASRLVRDEILQVRPYYGSLHLTGDINYIVKPDLEHQCGSVCRVRLFTAPGCNASIQLVQSPGKDEVTVVGQRDQAAVEESQAHCEITLPIKYDLSADLSGNGGLSIEDLQNDTTSISTVTGTTTIRKLYCPLMRYTTHHGILDIPGKLLASVEAQGQALTICGNAIQAGSLSLRAEEVSVDLQSVHAGSLWLEARTAALSIKDITAASQLRADRAVVRVGNCSGSMQWELEEATVKMGVPQLEQDSNITVDSGTCTIACPTEYRYGVDLQSTQLTVRPEFSQFQTSSNKFTGVHHSGQTNNTTKKSQFSTDGAPLQQGRGGLDSPCLSVLVNRGAVEMIPWSWPLTPGLL